MYGSWKDTHMPFAQSFSVDYYEENSLLTRKNISDTLSLINLCKLDYIGIKLLSMPIESSSLKRRVGVNKDAITILNRIVKAK